MALVDKDRLHPDEAGKSAVVEHCLVLMGASLAVPVNPVVVVVAEVDYLSRDDDGSESVNENVNHGGGVVVGPRYCVASLHLCATRGGHSPRLRAPAHRR